MKRQSKEATLLQPAELGLRPTAELHREPRKVDKFPNDPLETLVLIVTSIGVIGGIYALVYLARINGAI